MAKKRKKKWIQGAIKREGALKRKAKAAGMSVAAFAQKHKGDKSLTGQQSRLYFTLMKMKKRKKKRR